MELGIFTSTFSRPTLEETLDAVASHGLHHVQINLACAGMPSLPERIEPEVAGRIRRAASERGIALTSLSGTFNMAHPDPAHRADGARRLQMLTEAAPIFGSRIVTICTGSRDPDDMWRAHPDNATPEAWRDLVETLTPLMAVAERAGVTIGVEPEPGNVIQTPVQARRLLREIDSPRLAIVLDPANLVGPGEELRIGDRVEEAFDLLGERIALAHGKDRGADGEVAAAGDGLVPWPRLVERLREIGYDGPIVLHGLPEAKVETSLAYLRQVLRDAEATDADI